MFNWINETLLKMTWLSNGVKWLVEEGLKIPVDQQLGGSLHFFIYDTVKIFILLAVLIFGISYIQSFFPPERTKRLLGGIKGIRGNILGALLGTITPF